MKKKNIERVLLHVVIRFSVRFFPKSFKKKKMSEEGEEEQEKQQNYEAEEGQDEEEMVNEHEKVNGEEEEEEKGEKEEKPPGEEEEEKLDEAQRIFLKNSQDYALDRELGIKKAIESIMATGISGIPSTCTPDDLYFLVQSEAPQGSFDEQGYSDFYQNAYNIILGTTGPAQEEEDAYELTKDFVAERLSNLQPVGDDGISFQFTSFIVTNAQIADVRCLPDFLSLQDIELKTNYISDISPLTHLPKLTTLDLTENRVFSLDGLVFDQLEKLILGHNQISYLNHFTAPKLKTLDLSNNKIFFIEPNALLDCPLIEDLNLSTNAIRTLKEDSLKGLKNLHTYKVDSNNFEDLATVLTDEMTEVVDIDISMNPIYDLSPLTKLPKLQVLDIHGTSIETMKAFAPLQNMDTILYLYIYDTVFSESETARIEAVHYLKMLEEIDETAVTFEERQEAKNVQEPIEEEEEEEAKRNGEEEEEEEGHEKKHNNEEEEGEHEKNKQESENQEQDDDDSESTETVSPREDVKTGTINQSEELESNVTEDD